MVKAHLHANAPYCSVVRSKQSVLNVQSPHGGMRFCNYFYNVVCFFLFSCVHLLATMFYVEFLCVWHIFVGHTRCSRVYWDLCCAVHTQTLLHTITQHMIFRLVSTESKCVWHTEPISACGSFFRFDRMLRCVRSAECVCAFKNSQGINTK